MKKVRLTPQELAEIKADEEVTSRYNKFYFLLFAVYQVLVIAFSGAFLRPQSHLLSSVNGVDNALFVATGSYLLVLIGTFSKLYRLRTVLLLPQELRLVWTRLYSIYQRHSLPVLLPHERFLAAFSSQRKPEFLR